MELIKLSCDKCGANLNMDMEHLMAFCPYCGNKLMIGIADIQPLLIEKEKTRQAEIQAEIEHNKKWDDFKIKRKQDNYGLAVFVVGLIIALIMMFVPIFLLN